MRDKIVKLIDLKSIVTLTLTVSFVVMSGKGQISAEQFITVFTTVIAFYFGVQYNKNSPTANNSTEKTRKER
ncbi:MAG: hypothetical protein IKV85_10660 [Ruminococcus sp.]|nr:hypothetical protein [Ruminococcus sp.]